MAKDSFHEQFPGYDLIPEKKSRKLGWAIVFASIAALLAVCGAFVYQMSKLTAPVPAMAGMNKFSLSTYRNAAITQFESGQYAEAVKNFTTYFQMGGDDPKAKDLLEQAKVRALTEKPH